MGLRTVVNTGSTLLLRARSHYGANGESRCSADLASLFEDDDRKAPARGGCGSNQAGTARADYNYIENPV
jgi:hypothetical protein